MKTTTTNHHHPERNQEMSELREGDRVRLVTHPNWGVGTVHALFSGAPRVAIVKFGTGTKTCWVFDLVKEVPKKCRGDETTDTRNHLKGIRE